MNYIERLKWFYFMDVIVTYVGFVRSVFKNVLHLSYTYSEPDIVLTIINDGVHIIDMCDVVGVTFIEK